MHADTIKRAWKILEENKLVTYEGPASYTTTYEEWKKDFMERKKYKAGFYKLPKD